MTTIANDGRYGIVLLARGSRGSPRSAKHRFLKLPQAVLALTGSTITKLNQIKSPTLGRALNLVELAGTAPASISLPS